MNIINATNSNLAIGSPNSYQLLAVSGAETNDVQLAIDGLASLLATSKSLTEVQSETLRDAVDELKDESSRDDPKPHRLKKWLAKAELALKPVGAVADVAAVAALVQAAIATLP